MQAIEKFLARNLAELNSPSKVDRKSEAEKARFSGFAWAGIDCESEISLSTLLPSLVERVKPRPFSGKSLSDSGA